MKERLTARTIADLDNGIVGELIDAALSKATADLSDRGSDGQRRKVTISVELFQGNSRPITEVKVSASIPAYKSNATVHSEKAIAHGEVGLFFQTENAEAPDQETFDYENANNDKE